MTVPCESRENAQRLRCRWSDARIDCPQDGSAVPRKVIIRPQPGSLLFITQPDHAAAAADAVTHFDGFAANPRRADIHLAVREHDCGWQRLDDDLVFDDVSGRALDFMGVPGEVKRSVWPIAVDAVASRSAYAAALVAEHAAFVYSSNRGKPDWDPFFQMMEQRRDELLARERVPIETLRADYPFLGVADLLSLSFCHSWTHARERFGRSIRCEHGAVTMTPSLLPGAPVPLRVRARTIADRPYGSVEAVQEELARAPVEFLAGVARSGSPA
jgi:hypothetical protein